MKAYLTLSKDLYQIVNVFVLISYIAKYKMIACPKKQPVINA